MQYTGIFHFHNYHKISLEQLIFCNDTFKIIKNLLSQVLRNDKSIWLTVTNHNNLLNLYAHNVTHNDSGWQECKGGTSEVNIYDYH